MVVTTANAHKELAAKIAPFLDKEQIIVLNPGRTGGAFEVSNSIRANYGPFKPQVVEAQSLLFVARSNRPGFVTISGIKKEVPISTFPSFYNKDVIPLLNEVHHAFKEKDSVLNTSFDNIGAIFHPAPLLLNVARCEDPRIEYRHYIDGISPSIALFLEKMDEERINIARSYGIDAIPLKNWLTLVYESNGKNLYETIQNTKEYQNIVAPSTLNVRYIFEDVPTGLVPLASFGEAAGVPTPHLDLIINLANCFSNVNYCLQGRTLASMDLDKIPPYLLKEYATLGEEARVEIMELGGLIEND
jgi:opine dehydrogenase